MQEYIDFVSENPLYFVGLAILIGLIINLEISRMTRKFKMVNTNEAVKIMNQDNAVVIDVREDKEIQGNIIKGAQHITLAQLSDRMGHLGTNKQVPVLVYCQRGNRSTSACQSITKAGFENVSALTGGIISWETANLPTVSR